jgi:hypothetical protein
VAAKDEIVRNQALIQRRVSMALERLVEAVENHDHDETEKIRSDITILTSRLLEGPGWKLVPLRTAVQGMHGYDSGTKTDPRAGWLRDREPSIRCMSCGGLREAS